MRNMRNNAGSYPVSVKGAIVMAEVKATVKKSVMPVAAEVKPTVAEKPVEKKEPVKKEPVKKETEKKSAAKSSAVKKAVPAKKVAVEEKMCIQFAGKSYEQEDLVKIAKDIWRYDLKKKIADINSVELYVKPEENMVYYVINGDIAGSFDI